ncbi:MAG: spondin domain-containing protein [Myxococcota bacterium]
MRVSLLVVALLAASPAQAVEGARYRVTFDAVWSAATHPTDFPDDPHFSPPVGATHGAQSSFWEPGQLASPGIKNMAERGQTVPLTGEMASGGAESVFTMQGFDSPGSRSREFTIYDDNPLVTLVSMIAPSPDWFVGISGVPLHTGTDWVDPLVIQLIPWDAGTDSGTTFMSPNQATMPPQPIAAITGFPFQGAPPLGTFTFELVRVLADCENALDDDGDGLVDEDDPGCDDPSDPSEKTPTLICDDGIDNDGDGATDYPADDGCVDLFDGTEGDPASVPALSFGAAVALAALLLASGARRSRRA